MESPIKDLKSINKNSTIDKVDDDRKIGRANSQMDFQAKLSKSKNKMRSFSAKSQLMIEQNFVLSFLTLRLG